MPLMFTGKPAAVTSRGLSVDLFLLPCKDVPGADFQAVLSCERRVEGKPKATEAPVVYLKSIWGLGDNFARVRTDLMRFTSPDVSVLETGYYMSVFVKQNPSSDLRVIRIVAAQDNSQLQLPGNRGPQSTEVAWRIKEAHPKHGWNEETQCFETRDLVLGLPAAVFRIEVDMARRAPVLMDVAVGMQVHNQRTCRSWCQIIDREVPHFRLENSWNIAEREARSGSVTFTELSTRKFHNVDVPTWAIVTERNRKRGVEISLHVVSEDSSLRSKNAPGEWGPGGVATSDERFSDLEVVFGEEFEKLRVPMIEYRPAGSKRLEGHAPWESEVRSLLEDVCVVDSIKITVFQGVERLRKVRRLPAEWDRDGHGRSSSPLEDLRNYWLIRQLDSSVREPAYTLGGNNVKRARAFLAHSGAPDGFPDPFLQLRPIHWAVIGQTAEIVRLVLAAGANPLGSPTARRVTSLHLAAMAGNETIVDLLLDAISPAPETYGHTEPTAVIGDYPLHFAAAYATEPSFWADVDRYRRLCGGSQRNSLGETPLHRAAAMKNLAAVEFLTRQKNVRAWDSIPVNTVDNFGRTALWHAACVNSMEVVRALVGAGADVHLPDDSGLTPAHVAAREYNPQTLQALIEAGADVERPAGALHLRPSHMAAIFGRVRPMALLMTENAEIMSKLDDGTPLNAFHFALANRHEDCARIIWDLARDRKDLEFVGWSLCVVLATTGPELRWMAVDIDQERWIIMENPDQDRGSLVRTNSFVPALWVKPRDQASDAGSDRPDLPELKLGTREDKR